MRRGHNWTWFTFKSWSPITFKEVLNNFYHLFWETIVVILRRKAYISYFEDSLNYGNYTYDFAIWKGVMYQYPTSIRLDIFITL